MADNTTDTSQLVLFSGDAEKIKAEIVRQGVEVYLQANPGNEDGAKAAEVAFTSLADSVAPIIISTTEQLRVQNSPDINILSENIKNAVSEKTGDLLSALMIEFPLKYPLVAAANPRMAAEIAVSLQDLAPQLNTVLLDTAKKELEIIKATKQEASIAAEAGDDNLYGAQSNDYLQPYLDDPYVERFIELDEQANTLFDNNKNTRQQQTLIIDRDRLLRGEYERYKAEKPIIVTENEGAVLDILRSSKESVETANSTRRELEQQASGISARMTELRAKIDEYVEMRADGETVPEDFQKELNSMLDALPSPLRSFDATLGTLSAMAANAEQPRRKLKELIYPEPAASAIEIGSENKYYTETKALLAAGGTGGLAALYSGFSSDDGAAQRIMLLAGLSNPALGETALAGWPDGKPRYAAPLNPQGAIAAAIENAVVQQTDAQDPFRRWFDTNIPLGAQITNQFDPTVESYKRSQGLDHISGTIYKAGLEGFAEAGLDPSKKGQYTKDEIEAATRLIAIKVRTALLTDSNGNRITDSNSIAVVDELTGITTSGNGYAFKNHYGMNLAGVYEALITSEYGSPTAKKQFEANTTQFLQTEKAKAGQNTDASVPSGENISLLGAYALFLNQPAMVDEMYRVAVSGDPESTAKLAGKIGQGGQLARELSATLNEAGVSVNFGEAQAAIDKAIAPAIAETLQRYGHVFQSGTKLTYEQTVAIATSAGTAALAKMSALGPSEIGALSDPDISKHIAGIYDGSDGSGLSVASITAALFAARAGDSAAQRKVHGQAVRGAVKQGLPEIDDIVAGAALLPPTVPNADATNQAITAAMIDARENAQAEGIGRMFQRIWDFIQVLICIATTDYTLGDIGSLMAQRDQDRFEDRYASNLRGLPPELLGGYSAQQVYQVSLNRVYEQRAGISREESPALRFNNENAAGQSSPETATRTAQQQLPGFDRTAAMIYYDDGTGKLEVTEVTPGMQLPDKVKEAARTAANNGNTILWHDDNGNKTIDTGEVGEVNDPYIRKLAAARGGIEIN